jgi:hypothetical protein
MCLFLSSDELRQFAPDIQLRGRARWQAGVSRVKICPQERNRATLTFGKASLRKVFFMNGGSDKKANGFSVAANAS